MKKFFWLMAIAVCNNVWAGWKLDNATSHLNFVSIKKSQIAESHSFKSLSGNITDNKVSFSVALASVNTGIEIRNERMIEHLFKASLFPSANFTTTLPEQLLSSLKAGDTQQLDLSGIINIHGVEQAITLPVFVAKLGDNKLLVNNIKPLLIKASDFNLSEGILKLAEIAQLPSITETVPVNFTLVFIQ